MENEQIEKNKNYIKSSIELIKKHYEKEGKKWGLHKPSLEDIKKEITYLTTLISEDNKKYPRIAGTGDIRVELDKEDELTIWLEL